jgi:hypothetical protein
MKWSLLGGLVSILVIASSCEKIIPIDIPETQRKIVVNGLISPGLPVSVNLTKSLTVLENDDFVYLENASVKLYENGTLLGTMTQDTGVGNSYKLTVDYKDLASVEAETTIPEGVEIASWDTSKIMNEWGIEGLKLNVVFDDPADQENIYGYSVYLTYKEFDYLNMRPTGKWLTQIGYVSEGEDTFIEDENHYYGGKTYFEDHIFNGQRKTLDLRLYGFDYLLSDTIRVDINLEQVSPEFYKYVVSNEAYQRSHRNPFSEPVQVYTNIKGGFGIFSSYSVNTKSFIVRKTAQ